MTLRQEAKQRPRSVHRRCERHRLLLTSDGQMPKKDHERLSDSGEFGASSSAAQQGRGPIKERLFDEFVESGLSCFAIFDNEMRYVVASHRWRERSRLDSSYVGRSAYDLYPNMPQNWIDAHKRALGGEFVRLADDHFVRPDGVDAWATWECGPWRNDDGSIGGIIILLDDTTRLVMAEDERLLFRGLVENSHEFVGMVDRDLKTKFINQAGLRMLGLHTKEEARKRQVSEYHFPEDTPSVEELIARVRRYGSGSAEVRFRHFVTGEPIWMLASYFNVNDSAGNYMGVAMVGRDITAQRKAEEDLRDLNAHLEARIHQEVRAHQAALLQLEQAEKMTALGQLASGVAHDFGNVLQAIWGTIDLIKGQRDDPAYVKELIQLIEELIQRGVSITERLLAFGRRGDQQSELLELPTILEGLKQILALTLGDKVNVELVIGDDLPAIRADRAQFETAIINLVANSRDAMNSRGTVSICARAEVISNPSENIDLRPGDYVRFEIVDHGCGMDESALSHALEPFFTTKPVGKGTGLGLSMAQDFARQSGGALTLESAVGVGTTVRFWLPATDMTRSYSQSVEDEDLHLHSARVLLVDDDPFVREMLARDLSDLGLTVLAAEDATHALAVLDEGEQIDVLITDLAMPGADGLQLIDETHKRRGPIPAILLTDFLEAAGTSKVFDTDKRSFALLQKPLRGGDILRRLSVMLDQRKNA